MSKDITPEEDRLVLAIRFAEHLADHRAINLARDATWVRVQAAEWAASSFREDDAEAMAEEWDGCDLDDWDGWDDQAVNTIAGGWAGLYAHLIFVEDSQGIKTVARFNNPDDASIAFSTIYLPLYDEPKEV